MQVYGIRATILFIEPGTDQDGTVNDELCPNPAKATLVATIRESHIQETGNALTRSPFTTGGVFPVRMIFC
jgi:hypothetical protein